jgi:23S rRNA pseudouridine1911/1915/1917 synthase
VRFDPERFGERLDVALSKVLTWRSRTSFRQLIRDGLVLLNDVPTRASIRVRHGDVARIRIPPWKRKLYVEPRDAAEVPIVFEDRWCVALDKPAGMPVHPAGRHLEGTLIHFLHKRYRRPDDPVADVVPRLMHRIDRETSGLVLASKDPDFHYAVGQQFEQRRVQKRYLAVVEGVVERDEGLIDFGIGPAQSSDIRLKLEARRDGSGLPSITWFRVVRRNERFTLLDVAPRTGRQHQIRIHLAAIGHPIVGDKIYGPDDRYFVEALNGGLSEEARRRLVLPRQALHSHALTFEHPWTGEKVTLAAPLAADLAALMEAAS